jgi:hypothetical protein
MNPNNLNSKIPKVARKLDMDNVQEAEPMLIEDNALAIDFTRFQQARTLPEMQHVLESTLQILNPMNEEVKANPELLKTFYEDLYPNLQEFTPYALLQAELYRESKLKLIELAELKQNGYILSVIKNCDNIFCTNKIPPCYEKLKLRHTTLININKIDIRAFCSQTCFNCIDVQDQETLAYTNYTDSKLGIYTNLNYFVSTCRVDDELYKQPYFWISPTKVVLGPIEHEELTNSTVSQCGTEMIIAEMNEMDLDNLNNSF